MRPHYLRWLLTGCLFTTGAYAADPDCSLLSYGSGIDGSTDCVVLTAGATSFNGLLRDQGSEVGVILLHGRNTAFDGDPMVQYPNAVVVKQLRTHLSGLGYSTLSIETPSLDISADTSPANGTADFSEYAANVGDLTADVFARINAAINELASRSVTRIVLAGFSMGSRYATAATAAAELGLLGNSREVVGLIGAGMETSLAGSTPTSATPLSLADINGYDTLGNLSFVTVPVLDIYGNLDASVASTAAARAAGYAGDMANYTQLSLTCPDFGSQPYKFKRGDGSFGNYTENRCHQLRNGYLFDGSNTVLDVAMIGNPSRPVEVAVTDWLVTNNGFSVAMPVPGSLLLLGAGLVALRQRRKLRWVN